MKLFSGNGSNGDLTRDLVVNVLGAIAGVVATAVVKNTVTDLYNRTDSNTKTVDE